MSKAKSVLKVVVIVLSTALVIGLFSTFFAPKKEAEPSECAHENVRTLQGYVQSCEFPGLTEGKECADCGAILVAQQEIPMDDHNIVVSKKAVDPTCYSYGLTEEKSCSVCGKIMEEQRSTTKLPHPGQEAVDEVPATCISVGYTAGSRCTTCRAVITGCEEVPKKNHEEKEIIEAVDPTCTSVGWTEGERCKYCREVLVAPTEIPQLLHTYRLTDSTVTCTMNGSMLYICTGCQAEKREYVSAPGHTWVSGACSLCDESMLLDEVQLVRGVKLNTESETRPELGFNISVEEGYEETLSENQEIGAYVMEYEKANAVANKGTTTDWANKVEGYFKVWDAADSLVIVYVNGDYEKINTQYVVVPAVRTTLTSGRIIYQYASNSYEDGIKDGVNARSVAYIAGCVLNDTAMGRVSYSEDTIDMCETYIEKSADLAMGLNAPVYDGSTYKIIGHEKINNYTYRLIFENGIYEGIPVWFENSNCTYENGILTFDEGTTGIWNIKLYMAGNEYTLSVTFD